MNTKEIGEIRRRVRRDRSNMTAIYGCYVNENKEIISEFRQSTGMMSENEADKYFGLMRRSLSGSIGKNLIDINFKTSQVAGSPEHKLLMDLRSSELKDGDVRHGFYQKVIETVSLGMNYLILLGCDSYDVPFKSKDDETQADNSSETYTYLLCAICPVNQTKPTLHYVPENKEFHDGGITNVVSAPELGFLFPAFDERATNLYNALYYTKNTGETQEAFVDAVFRTPAPMPAAVQRESFQTVLGDTLAEDCSYQVVQAVHDCFCGLIEEHKANRADEPLTVSRGTVEQVLKSCGVAEERAERFGEQYDRVFGEEASLPPRNLVDPRQLEIVTPDVTIRVHPDRGDLVETRIIDGARYILIRAEEDVTVNGVPVQIG